jgi:hypothetical protein
VGTEYAVTTGRFQEAKSQAAFRQSILEGDGRIGAHNGRCGPKRPDDDLTFSARTRRSISCSIAVIG